ncbi:MULTISPECIES: relaxase/mobilization nuclease domain-containing protein [unclassified Rubrivivax]|uniref:relaxase/mobilization nuclease domain-containing protein n=1 Tax=unclassified Rubrivivax TaxID=2649762 RepID=UPI001E4DEDF8|nr:MULTISPECIES: hypothetical protein [unclassified Rubrivivax]MCC9597769.1 hypothetical protein [Rubrivivax sp. JA1055]MCC9645974.1 hypothetical protein [Rubrivivax sp. JA1029]
MTALLLYTLRRIENAAPTRPEAVADQAELWRHAGANIDDESPRREAFNLMLSMPQGTDARIVKAAAREFAQTELRGHRYVMVLHEHQANPHVHLSVRAQGADGRRLNPRKADLHRWRETFADKLRGYGVEAEATRQATRGAHHRAHPIGRVKMRDDGRPGRDIAEPGGERFYSSRRDALEAWIHIAQALGSSGTAEDRRLARGVVGFLKDSKAFRRLLPRLEQLPDRQREQARAPTRTPPQPELTRTRPDIDWERRPTPIPAPRAGRSSPPDGLGGRRARLTTEPSVGDRRRPSRVRRAGLRPPWTGGG